MDFLNLFISILLIILAGRYLYSWLFHAKNHVEINRDKRKEIRKKLIFMPQFLFFGFYDKNPEFEIWINRTVGLLFIVVSLVMFFVSVFGPILSKQP